MNREEFIHYFDNYFTGIIAAIATAYLFGENPANISLVPAVLFLIITFVIGLVLCMFVRKVMNLKKKHP